jgi:hypothetical protein
MPLTKANALFLELGEAPDADAITYINANNITRLQQQAGICRLVKFLKDKSLWTTLAGGFLFGNKVGASSGTSLPDLKGGTAATLTGGSHEVNGIYMNGNNADEISFGARTFTNNYMPSVYVLFSSYNATGSTTSSRINFGPLSSTSTYRGFQPHTHNQTGSTTLVHLQTYRGDGNRYIGSGSLSTNLLASNFIGAAFSSSNQLILGAQNALANNATSTIASAMTFAAGATWLLGPFENASKTSTELTTVSACLFWNSDTALTVQFVSQLDSLLREFVAV